MRRAALNDHVPGLLHARLPGLERDLHLPRDLDHDVEADGAVQRAGPAGRRVNVPDQAPAAGERHGWDAAVGQVVEVGGQIAAAIEVDGVRVGEVGEAEEGAAEVVLDGEAFRSGGGEVGEAGGEVGVGDEALGVREWCG